MERLKTVDVTIVGASAIGCVCARELASRGLETLVLEEDARAGKQGKCAGLVSRRGLDSLGVDYGKTVLNAVYGARIKSPRASFEVSRGEPVAFVLDRQAFDEELAREAREAGAKILLNHRAVGIKQGKEKDSVWVSCGSGTKFESRALVGADGASSFTARALDFPPVKEFVLCYEAEFEGARIEDQRFVDVILDARAFKGFFAWIIPAGDGEGGSVVRIGFGTKKFGELKEAKKALFSREDVSRAIEGARKKKEFAALIPLSTRAATQKQNVLLAGDAAGQTKATTGGGIVFGGNCARVAARCIAARLKESKPLDYERAWMKEFGRAFAAHSALRRILDLLDNASLDSLVSCGSKLGLPFFLNALGDMDFVVRF